MSEQTTTDTAVEEQSDVQAPTNGATPIELNHFTRRYGYSGICDIVLESRHLGLKGAAQKHGLPSETIRRWRGEVRTDPEMNKIYSQKRWQYNNDFAAATAETIRAQLDYLKRAAELADPEDKAMVRAIAGAMKMSGEFRLAIDITYSSLGRDVSKLPADQTYKLEPGDSVVEGKFTDDVQEITEEE